MRVKVSAHEVAQFKSQWPCSGLPDDTSFTFEFDTNGDLVDLYARRINGFSYDTHECDGPALVALSQDAQALTIGREIK